VDREAKYETALAIVHFVASLVLFMALVGGVGWLFRADLSRFGGWFIARFGFVGMAVGACLADSVHFPLPPQFYLLAGIAGGYGASAVIGSVLVGSELGGVLAFTLARVLVRRSAMLRKRVAAPQQLLARLIRHKGYLGLLVAMLLPISYSALCMASGALGLPYKAYAVIGAMRIPRILISYALIVAAWGAS
jgi:membrane protein YqaA with SNARE-associated domain